MNTVKRLALGLFVSIFCCVAALAGDSAPGGKGPALVQVGVIDALLAGGYDGSMTLGELRRLGDIGLGTFDALDGEMVVLDGHVHQVLASGKVVLAPDGLTTPFAQVTRLVSPRRLDVPAGLDLKAVEARLDAELGELNSFAVVRIDGRFASLTARSVPRQTPPYRPLSEVAKEQSVFQFAGVTGTLVGLRGPAYVRGLGVPGWHWHFLTQDRARGGHVLAFVLEPAGQARAQLQSVYRLELLVPHKGLGGLDLTRDRSKELHAVEAGQ